MYPNFIVDVMTGNDRERQRRRDEAWRAWHRQPDAVPLPDELPRSRGRHLALPGIGLSTLLTRLAGWSQIIRR
ncbi:MAG TPA: hypothetical protein VFO73_11870 [Candidatus Limnocylindrales bacterium]|nr:hypothetical protein [Candidatus Limnocylindrales bacterium]